RRLHHPPDPQQLPAHPPEMSPGPLSVVRCPWSVVVCLSGLLATCPGVPAKDDDGQRTTDHGPIFVLETVSGPSYRGPLAQLRVGWTLRLGGKNKLRREAGEWLALRRADAPPPPYPASPHLILTNGDRVPFAPESLSLAGEHLAFT